VEARGRARGQHPHMSTHGSRHPGVRAGDGDEDGSRARAPIAAAVQPAGARAARRRLPAGGRVSQRWLVTESLLRRPDAREEDFLA
jgi:hypothetical protein